MEGVSEEASNPLPEERSSVVAKEWSQERRGREGGRLIPEDFALHSGRTGAGTKLAAGGASDAVIQTE